MSKAKRSLSLTLAIAAGLSSFALVGSLRAAADPSDLITLCFRGKTIQVPLYLADRYKAVPGTTTGACNTSP